MANLHLTELIDGLVSDDTAGNMEAARKNNGVVFNAMYFLTVSSAPKYLIDMYGKVYIMQQKRVEMYLGNMHIVTLCFLCHGCIVST